MISRCLSDTQALTCIRVEASLTCTAYRQSYALSTCHGTWIPTYQNQGPAPRWNHGRNDRCSNKFPMVENGVWDRQSGVRLGNRLLRLHIDPGCKIVQTAVNRYKISNV